MAIASSLFFIVDLEEEGVLILPIPRIIAMAIIDAVEPSGMLSITLEEIHEGLAGEFEELELDEVVAVQHRLQQFDPCGVCSQNLSECLLVQLQQLPEATPFLDAWKKRGY